MIIIKQILITHQNQVNSREKLHTLNYIIILQVGWRTGFFENLETPKDKSGLKVSLRIFTISRRIN